MKKITLAIMVCIISISLLLGGCVTGEAKGGVANDAATKAECGDKIDNDGDGLVDTADSGCVDKKDTDESDCGDGVCEGDEECNACVADCGTCGPMCGDAECNGDETCETCPADCGDCLPECGDSVCEGDETCGTCEEDCGVCDSCSDTDLGQDYWSQGTVSGYNNGIEYSYTDLCTNSTLTEYFCSGDSFSATQFDCNANMTSCINGACQ